MHSRSPRSFRLTGVVGIEILIDSNLRNCRFYTNVTMTLIKRRKRLNSFIVFSHAKISSHHYTMSEDDDIVMMI